MNAPRPRRALALLAVVAVLGAACTSDDGDASADDSTTVAAATATTSPALTAGLPVTTLTASTPAATEAMALDTTTPNTETVPTTAAPAAEVGGSTPETVPESGVPGLDSDDRFCAAWSRFGGTWQVLLVGSTFLDDPDRIARWEVASAPLVVDAYTELLAQLPADLAPERDALADGYFGVFERRASDARESLVASGANGADVAGLSEAWLAALETRDPSTPEVAFVEPDALVLLVDAAAADLLARRSAFHLDPSLVVSVDTPLTDAYLEVNCPDQGTLAGGEVGG